MSSELNETLTSLESMDRESLVRTIADLKLRQQVLEEENARLKEACAEIGTLRQREELYRSIFDNTGTSIILIEDDMTISMANRRFLRKIGRSAKEVLGRMKWTDMVRPEERERMRQQHRLRRESPEEALSTYEFSYTGKNGETQVALVNILMVPETKKSIASLIDITAHKNALKHLEISEEKFRTMAESVPCAILMHQGDYWIYANRAAVEISGYSEEEFCAMKFWDLVHPDYRELIRQSGRNRQQGKEVPTSYEFIIITKAGEERWVSLTGSRIEYEEKPTALIAVLDITERKRAEEERRALEEQLQQSQKLESIGRLAGGVAHDFNNMLGVILGHAELSLLKLKQKKDLETNLNEIKKAAERSSDLTRQLLAFARKQTVSLQVLDLNDTVAGMITMLRRLIGEDIDLDWQPGDGIWALTMDPSQIDQILANLCVNARDAMAGGGTLSIETGNAMLDESYTAGHAGFIPGEYVKIAVSDNGCGMDKETLSHIFEPFFTTKPMGLGTGLGLSTVYGIVKQNKGFINTYSEPGRGTTVTIYLPRYRGKGDFPSPKPLEKDSPEGCETILLVEDEPAILEVTAMMLEMHGYTVLVAGSPKEALDLAEGHEARVHLLLTDVVMPEMNGRLLSERLSNIHPGIKSLFMSGYTANVIAHQGVLDEGVHFIQKPFSSKDLAEKVRDVLDGG